MTYQTLEAQLLSAILGTGYFAHVAPHTQPPDTLYASYTQGLPAALLRLLHLPYVQDVANPGGFAGVAQVEVTLMAPAKLDYGLWQTYITDVRAILMATSTTGIGQLSIESSQPMADRHYRFVVLYKVNT
jgi:hypothetical protein